MGSLNNLWPENSYRPLRVVARMAGPIAMLPHDGLPLDAVLEYAAFKLGWPPVLQYTGPDGRRHLPGNTDADPANWVLPLKRIGHKCHPDWYWSCSWAQFPDGFETDRQHWNKRHRFTEPALSRHLSFSGRTEKISPASGRYKGYHMPLSLVLAPTVEWYCCGSADGLLKLLPEITHLGHKRSQGWGEVARWEVWPAREDWSCWRDGQPMRAMPDQPGEHERGHVAIRAPSWHPSRRRLCILPATREHTHV